LSSPRTLTAPSAISMWAALIVGVGGVGVASLHYNQARANAVTASINGAVDDNDSDDDVDDDVDEDMRALRRFVGEWTGEGHGTFPTVPAFRYTETTRFYCNGIEPMLQFEQRTWKDGKAGEPLHWETGFVRALPAHGVEVTNAQNGERVEVLRGAIDTKGDGGDAVVFAVDSTLIGNDERLVRTRRRYALAVSDDGVDTLCYQVWMATTRVPELTLHLQARLLRKSV
jgi:hypothetical protein